MSPAPATPHRGNGRRRARRPRGLARGVVTLLLVALAGAAGFGLLAWRSEMAPVPPAQTVGFADELIVQGQRLAQAGNCVGCHTPEGGAPLAGGLPIPTPFGTVYSTNITPDRDTGIGEWSQAAFDRAMREGVDRRGAHLYPAFPYTHFTRVADSDLQALYAYLMTRTPVRSQPPPNELMFPLGFRPLLAGWKLLFFEPRRFIANPAQSAQWNRGAYLAEALAHCSACHTPRNALGAERRDQHFEGGETEGWHAPALTPASPSPVPWTVEALTTYLRTGLVEAHAIAGGPMQDVVRSLAQLPADDLRAIAEYVQSGMGTPSPERAARADALIRGAAAPTGATRPFAPASAAASATASTLPIASTAPSDEARTLQLGATVYAGACASCHELGRQASSGSGLQLPLAVALYEPTPASLIQIVLHGIKPRNGERGRWMPAFANELTDAQLLALLAYLRRAAADAPPWPDLGEAVEKGRKG